MRDLPLLEKYIVSRAHQVSVAVTEALGDYRYAEASREASDFLWNELADWFIEASKSRLKPDLLSSEGADDVNIDGRAVALPSSEVSMDVLLYVWGISLKLLHPIMPFVTEALWQVLHNGSSSSIMISEWPVMEGAEPLSVDQSAVANFEVLKAIVRAIRNTRTEYNVSPTKRVAATLDIRSDTLRKSLAGELASLAFLGRLNGRSTRFVNFGNNSDINNDNCVDRPEFGKLDVESGDHVQLVIHEGVVVYLPLSDLIDKEKEIERLNKQISKVSREVEALKIKLSQEKFVERAKPEIVTAARSQLSEGEDVLAALRASLDRLL